MASSVQTIEITCDFHEFDVALERLESLAESSPELFEGGLNLPFTLDQAFRLQSDPLPAGTRELLVRLKPTEALLSFLAARGAGDSDLVVVEES